MNLEKKTVLYLTVFSEALLAAVAVGWSFYRGQPLFQATSMGAVLLGTSAALPLLAGSWVLFRPRPQPGGWPSFNEFRREIVQPLANVLDPASAFFVSLCAGFGEELFFRVVLQHELGNIAASAIFAALHFGPFIRKYLAIALIYFLVSLYLGWLYQLTADVTVVIATHAVYDFAALLYLRRAREQQLC